MPAQLPPIPDALLSCPPAALIPQVMNSDADFIDWILDDRAAGDECRTKLGIVRGIERGGQKP